MSKVTITIETNNSAFDCPGEFSRMLKKLAKKMEDGPYSADIYDINGNEVGKVEVED